MTLEQLLNEYGSMNLDERDALEDMDPVFQDTLSERDKIILNNAIASAEYSDSPSDLKQEFIFT